MKIYAIRDRLIDYFMQPFAAPSDKDVLAALARQVNQEGNSDIQTAPHHFEIWRLGEVSDQGNLSPSREFLADCSSLIRPGIRRTGVADSPTPESEPYARRSRTSGDRSDPATDHRPIPSAAQAASVAAGEEGGRSERGDRPRDS